MQQGYIYILVGDGKKRGIKESQCLTELLNKIPGRIILNKSRNIVQSSQNILVWHQNEWGKFWKNGRLPDQLKERKNSRCKHK